MCQKKFSDDKCDNDESVLIDLDDVPDGLDCSEDFAPPSDDFDCKLFLNSIKLPPNEKRPLVMDIKNVMDSINSPEAFLELKKFFRISGTGNTERYENVYLQTKNERLEESISGLILESYTRWLRVKTAYKNLQVSWA